MKKYVSDIYNIPLKQNAATKARTTERMKEDYLKAAELTMGCVREACRKAHISHATYYNYIKNDPEFAAKVEEIREAQKDFVEDALIKKIAQGDTKAILWASKCLLKDRGYNEKTQIDVNVPTEYVLNFGGNGEDE